MNFKKESGYVKKYDSKRGFGFIISNTDSKQYFFHISNLVRPFSIEPGETEVLFLPTTNDKGLAATSVEEVKVEIQGKFANIYLPNITEHMPNEQRLVYLKKQYEMISGLLDTLKSFGISSNKTRDWISLDSSMINSLLEPEYTDGHRLTEVPSGYRRTAKHLIDLLQKHLNYFNRDYVGTNKGIDGERKTMSSLRSVMLDYPVLNNVRFELTQKTSRYSAESDVIVITDRAVFVIETKNYGGKGDTITVSPDGLWTLCDGYTHKERVLNNPFKQATDHIFAIRNFFRSKGIDLNLQIIPIVAIANDNVKLNAPSSERILRVDMIGTYILDYINMHSPVLQTDDLRRIREILSIANLPPKSYPVIDYYENLTSIVGAIRELLSYWVEDSKKEREIRAREEEERKRIQAERERQARFEKVARERKAAEQRREAQRLAEKKEQEARAAQLREEEKKRKRDSVFDTVSAALLLLDAIFG